MSADHNQSKTHNSAFAEGGAIDSCPVCGLRVDSTVTICPRDGSVIGDFSSTEKLLDNRYQVLSMIATGGMGSIYKARQPALNKTVAIKMLKVQNRGDGAWARFQQEAKAVSQLEHPNIIRVYDFGETADGQPFMVMDYVEGSNLQNLLKAENTLPIEDALNIFRQICAGMTHAHSKKVFHRDLKPGNIMLSGLEGTNPQVRIVDFGLAKVMDGTEDLQKLTQTGEVFGSPLYMSPEQALGKKVDARSDIYSLGCIMHETLTGTLPLMGATPFETLMKHMNDKPLNLRQAKRDGKFSDELVVVCSKTLAKDPNKRFQSMDELQEALDAVPEAIVQAKQRALLQAARTTGAQKNIQPTLAKTWKLEQQELKKPESSVGWRRHMLLGLVIVALIGGVALAYVIVSGMTTKQSEPVAVSVPLALSKEQADETQNSQDDLNKMDGYQAKQETDPDGLATIYLNGEAHGDSDLAQEVSKNPDTKRVLMDRVAVTDEGLQVLQDLPLVELSLQRLRVSDTGLEVLKHFPNLKKLSLANCSNVTDKTVKSLRGLNQLQALDLSSDSDVTDEGLSNLPKSLEMLFLKGGQISAKGCAKIGELPKLTTLDLADTPIANDDLKVLQKLPKLQNLSLAGTGISDKGMELVIKANGLEHLNLAHTRITKKGFFLLAQLPRLRSINIDKCTFLKYEDVDSLMIKAKHTIVMERPPRFHH
jgi:serine/threonine protein kinase